MSAVVALVCAASVAVVASPAHAVDGCPALDGSAVLAAIEQLGVAVVCEARPAGAPSYTTGMWDGSTIRLWVEGIDDRNVRKIAGHELGHATGDGHVDEWAALRGGAGQTAREDYAEMFSLVNFAEPGVGYTYWLGSLSSQQRALMRFWWAGEPVEVQSEPERPAEQQTAVQPPLEAVHVPAPVEAVHVLASSVERARVVAVLAALREAS